MPISTKQAVKIRTAYSKLSYLLDQHSLAYPLNQLLKTAVKDEKRHRGMFPNRAYPVAFTSTLAGKYFILKAFHEVTYFPHRFATPGSLLHCREEWRFAAMVVQGKNLYDDIKTFLPLEFLDDLDYVKLVAIDDEGK